jgi:hypothetical protein
MNKILLGFMLVSCTTIPSAPQPDPLGPVYQPQQVMTRMIEMHNNTATCYILVGTGISCIPAETLQYASKRWK